MVDCPWRSEPRMRRRDEQMVDCLGGESKVRRRDRQMLDCEPQPAPMRPDE
jgi:hypothetical protein